MTAASYAEGLNWAIASGRAYWNGSEVVQSESSETLYLDVPGPILYDEYNSRFYADYNYREHPISNVTWYGAAAYCNWRSERNGLAACYNTTTWECDFDADGYRLPTEAEWEKAARGSWDKRDCPWGNSAPDCERVNGAIAWGGNCVGQTTPVGSYPTDQSPYGLYDMAGNVWEHCNDWWDARYYDYCPTVDPQGPSSGSHRVSRGGGTSVTVAICAARTGAPTVQHH